MPAPAYSVRLDPQTEVVLAALPPSAVLNLAKQIGAEPSQTVRVLKLARLGATASLREVNGEKAGPTHPLLSRAKSLNALQAAWTQIHTPTEAEAACVKSMGVEGGGERDIYHLKLPGGRLVRLAEVPPDTVESAVREAEMGAKSEVAQGFLHAMAAASRSVVSVDGNPVGELRGKGLNPWTAFDALFSAKEAYLLGAAFAEIHGAPALGEVEPVALSG